MESKCKETTERRSFVRIDDKVILKYRKTNSLELQAGTESFSTNANSFTIKAQFAAIDQKNRQARSILEQHSTELANHLKAIDEKLDLLADIAFEMDHDLSKLSTQKVNLSAGGTSFLAQKPLELGTLLELWLLLLPSHTGIITYATVIYCKRSNDEGSKQYPYKIGVEFKNIREEDADLIACHVLKKEANERRRRPKMTCK
ncbi:PilZ domain-containing protein [Thiolapillus sp.]